MVRVTTAQVGSLGLRVGIRLLHSSDEPDELSQWLYNDNSIVNVVLGSVCCYYGVIMSIFLLFLLQCNTL